VLEQIVIALVRLLRRAEAGELPHGEHAAAIHRGVYAARVGILAREAEIATEVHTRQILRRVERANGDAGQSVGIESRALLALGQTLLVRGLGAGPRAPTGTSVRCRSGRRGSGWGAMRLGPFGAAASRGGPRAAGHGRRPPGSCDRCESAQAYGAASRGVKDARRRDFRGERAL